MFLLATPFPLGEVRNLKLLHDNSGGRPSWYQKLNCANLKGQITPKLETHIFLLTHSAVYSSRLIYSELPSFQNICARDVQTTSGNRAEGSMYYHWARQRQSSAEEDAIYVHFLCRQEHEPGIHE